MTLSPVASKLNLTAHITFSAGWIGAIVAFLSLAIGGLLGENPEGVRSMYIGMEVIAWFVIIPFCISAFLTGIVQSLTTQWGLFRHYWILIKLVLTTVATIVLMMHMQPITHMASIATQRSLNVGELQGLRIQLIADASVAIFVLLVAMALSVYKPFGRIQASISNPTDSSRRKQSLGFYLILGLILLFITVVILHLFGISLGHH
ncbi:MAG: hypothetical protein JST46_10895 [Bacteroidetes bacterium]|nr:hypothetical protein [Bacteroidota bacterium]